MDEDKFKEKSERLLRRTRILIWLLIGLYIFELICSISKIVELLGK